MGPPQAARLSAAAELGVVRLIGARNPISRTVLNCLVAGTMSVNGVALGLQSTGLPFSFTALLGLLSLTGMLIKNGIVLVEEIDIVRRIVKTED